MIIIAGYHRVRSIAGHTFRLAAKWILDLRAKRAKKAALYDLLFAPEHRLRDVGIQREELIRAIESGHRRKCNLTLHSRSSNRLDTLREATEAQSDSEVVRQALRYFEQFFDDLARGKKLFIVTSTGDRREVMPASLEDDPADGAFVRRNLLLQERSSLRLDALRSFCKTASESEVVRRALKLYEILVVESARGSKLLVGADEDVLQVRIGSFLGTASSLSAASVKFAELRL